MRRSAYPPGGNALDSLIPPEPINDEPARWRSLTMANVVYRGIVDVERVVDLVWPFGPGRVLQPCWAFVEAKDCGREPERRLGSNLAVRSSPDQRPLRERRQEGVEERIECEDASIPPCACSSRGRG